MVANMLQVQPQQPRAVLVEMLKAAIDHLLIGQVVSSGYPSHRCCSRNGTGFR